jgi:hypothetical protein
MTQIALASLILGIFLCVCAWFALDLNLPWLNKWFGSDASIPLANYLLIAGLVLIVAGAALAGVALVVWIT